MTTTARILAKGCNATGITEGEAKKFHDQLGRTVVAIVELRSTSVTDSDDGSEAVSLTLLTVEPCTDPDGAERLREIARALYRNRAEEDGQARIDETLEPRSIGDVIGDAEALPFFGGRDDEE